MYRHMKVEELQSQQEEIRMRTWKRRQIDQIYQRDLMKDRILDVGILVCWIIPSPDRCCSYADSTDALGQLTRLCVPEMPQSSGGDRDRLECEDHNDHQLHCESSQFSFHPHYPDHTGALIVEDGHYLQGYSKQKLVHSLIVLATKMRHNGTYCSAANMSEKIEIVKEHPDQPQTTYKFKESIERLSTSLSIHHFCNRCKQYGGKQSESNGSGENDSEGVLICESCENRIDTSANWKKGNTVVSMSLYSQLSQLFSQHGDFSISSKKRAKECSFAIEDIYDGRMYKKKMKDDMISINFSVDGVSIFYSSKYGMHPIVCTINEWAPEKRPQTMLLCGLYCGVGKVPNMNAN